MRAQRILFVLIVLAAATQARAQDAELAALVDLPAPAARRARAKALARDERWALDDWRGAMRRFRPRARGGTDAPSGIVRAVAAIPAGTGATRAVDVTLYLPDGRRADRPAPLLLALHGTGGEGAQEARRWQRVADALGMIVCAPTDAGDNVGYTFERRERDEALAVLRWVRRRHDIDENRIHLTGVSRGGHMTWDLGTRHPDHWASLAPMIGGPRLDPSRGHNNLRYVENVAHLPLRDLQGERDDPRLLFNLRYAFARLEKARATDAKLLTFPELGHGFRFDAVDWASFLGGAQRDSSPARVVRCAANPDETRAFWCRILRFRRGIEEEVVPQVRADTWSRLDDAGRRRFMAEAATKRTARLDVAMTAPGVFTAKSTGVARFRLLLTPAMTAAGAPEKVAVKVTWNGRTRTKRVRASKSVLLAEFAERFDRTYLPVHEIVIP